MPLNDLSLEELTDLAGTLEQIRFAGADLAAAGLTPTFNLTPGQLATITVPFALPAASLPTALAGPWSEVEHPDTVETLTRMADELPPLTSHPEVAAQFTPEGAALIAALQTQSTEAAPDLTQSGEAAPARAEPVDPPPANGDMAGGNPIPSAPEQSATGLPEPIPPAASPQDDPLPVTRAVEGSGGGHSDGSGSTPPAASDVSEGTVATANFTGPAPAPIAGSASALAATSGQKLWTEEEDARLVNLVATAIVNLGLPKKTAISEAARILGRPEQATHFRVYNKVKTQLAAAISALAMDQAQTETPDAGEPPSPIEDEPDVEPGQRDAGTTVRAAASIEGQLADADPLIAHLDQLTYKDGWSLERDVEFLELKGLGWNENEIALEMKIQAKLLRPRLDLLTGAYTDDKGKLQRRFGHVAVFAALQARLNAKTKAA